MPLRRIGRAVSLKVRAWLGVEASLLRLEQQGSTIIMKLDDLKAADAAEAAAVTSALAEIKSLSEQHKADMAELAAQSDAGEDIKPLVASMRGRSETLLAAIAALHENVTSGSDTVTGAGSDTIVGGTSDTVSGAAGSDTIAAGTADSVAGADSNATL